MKKHIDIFNSLKQKWNEFKSDPNNKKIRIRNAAQNLGVSEAELLSTDIGEGVKYLFIDDINLFLEEILSIDKIMVLIRSDFVVHEKIIETQYISLRENMLINKFENKYPLLVYDKNQLMYSFFENKKHRKTNLRSFQFFDQFGNSIFKIYLKGKDEDKFDRIAIKYEADYNYELQNLNISEDEVLNDFNSINMHFKSDEILFSSKISSLKNNILRLLLTDISEQKYPIQIHAVGNKIVQYHRDVINNIIDYGPWINVIDKEFNIHVLENKIVKNNLIEYLVDSKKYYSIEFYDSYDKHVMGISSLKDNDSCFYNSLNKLGVLNESN